MLTTKILRTIQRYTMVRSGERILLGLSGGPDSVALTEALIALRETLGIELVIALDPFGVGAVAGVTSPSSQRMLPGTMCPPSGTGIGGSGGFAPPRSGVGAVWPFGVT